MAAFDPTVLPQFAERKGSLSLRSDHMNYGRGTLTSNWHQARESEPKDYDIGEDINARNLHKATYDRLATDNVILETTTKAATEQIKLKKDFESREVKRLMIGPQNVQHTRTKRETGAPERGHGSVVPRHHPDHDKRRLDTTHNVDFKNPWPGWSPSKEEKEDDTTPLDRRFHHHQSQFTDTADHRRHGIQTWQEESGVYSNSWFTTTRETHTVKQEKN